MTGGPCRLPRALEFESKEWLSIQDAELRQPALQARRHRVAEYRSSKRDHWPESPITSPLRWVDDSAALPFAIAVSEICLRANSHRSTLFFRLGESRLVQTGADWP